MGRRLPRRVWHTVAALVPLPLIGLGYVAAVPGNPVAFQVELFLSGNGSAYTLKRTADVSHSPLPREASYLSGPATKARVPIRFSPSTPSPQPVSSSSPRALAAIPP